MIEHLNGKPHVVLEQRARDDGHAQDRDEQMRHDHLKRRELAERARPPGADHPLVKFARVWETSA